jgi:hypothetical protein
VEWIYLAEDSAQQWFFGHENETLNFTEFEIFISLITVVKVLRYKSEGRWFDPR